MLGSTSRLLTASVMDGPTLILTLYIVRRNNNVSWLCFACFGNSDQRFIVLFSIICLCATIIVNTMKHSQGMIMLNAITDFVWFCWDFVALLFINENTIINDTYVKMCPWFMINQHFPPSWHESVITHPSGVLTQHQWALHGAVWPLIPVNCQWCYHANH